MVKFLGFENEDAAKKYQKEHGGYLTKAYTKTGRKSKTYMDYMFAVKLGGLDPVKYPVCLQWNNV